MVALILYRVENAATCRPLGYFCLIIKLVNSIFMNWHVPLGLDFFIPPSPHPTLPLPPALQQILMSVLGQEACPP